MGKSMSEILATYRELEIKVAIFKVRRKQYKQMQPGGQLRSDVEKFFLMFLIPQFIKLGIEHPDQKEFEIIIRERENSFSFITWNSMEYTLGPVGALFRHNYKRMPNWMSMRIIHSAIKEAPDYEIKVMNPGTMHASTERDTRFLFYFKYDY